MKRTIVDQIKWEQTVLFLFEILLECTSEEAMIILSQYKLEDYYNKNLTAKRTVQLIHSNYTR